MVVVSLESVRSEAGQDVIAELYNAHARRLTQIVRRRVRAPEPVVEDACQFAWDRLILHRDRVRAETALGWLATTALRQAYKLVARDGRELSFDELAEGPGEPALAAHMPAPDELVAQRARLAAIATLSKRQQRLVWLQGLGLSYAEMAQRTGATPRTVERQLLRAKRALRDV
jgi:RNA polymerase sigma factor (sigma-70 family)